MNDICLDSLIPLPDFGFSLPDGWLNGLDAALLYNATIKTGGAGVLEIGSWIGRSSCVIATAIKKCEELQRHFEIVDFGIAGAKEWVRRFGSSPFTCGDAEKFCAAIYAQGGTVAVLKQNLVDRDLSQYVDLIILGDFAIYKTTRKFSFVFCDCTHDLQEIEKNVPLISEILEKDSILICDDIATPEMLELVCDLSGMSTCYLSNRTDSYSKFGILTRGKYDGCFG